jgi:hypothetical protein
MTEAKWDALNIGEKIIKILHDVPDAAPEHHFGHPFLTAYQVAIEYARLYPQDVAEIGFPIGGRGSRVRNSLAQYLANGLSRRIKAGKLEPVEGGFLSNQHLDDISFNTGEEIIQSSVTDKGYTSSMFRLRD